jgi:hypothetical protein
VPDQLTRGEDADSPWRGVVTFVADGDRCRIAFDDDLSVVGVDTPDDGS